MTMFEPVATASQRVMAALVAGLALEFGEGAGKALAERFVAAEECDFVWAGRRQERWLGAYHSLDEEDCALERIAILGRLDRHWYVAVCIVDGDGLARGMIGRRTFSRLSAARKAYAICH